MCIRDRDLVVQAFYYQQPQMLARARELMDDPGLGWREGVERFLRRVCYGEIGRAHV